MKGKILIVDDMKVNQEILTNILHEEYEIMEADHGEQAWESIRKYRKVFSAVLMSLELPGLSGIQILEKMGESRLTDTLPVIIINDSRQDELEGKCLELGAADFICQPLDKKVVKRRVQNIVNSYAHKKQMEEKVENQMITLRKQYRICQQCGRVSKSGKRKSSPSCKKIYENSG